MRVCRGHISRCAGVGLGVVLLTATLFAQPVTIHPAHDGVVREDWPLGGPPLPMGEDPYGGYYPEPWTGDDFGPGGDCPDCGCADCICPDYGYEEPYSIGGFGAFGSSGIWNDKLKECRLHHSSTDGRHYGPRRPMRGTSWLNRPYYLGLAAGGFFMTQGVQTNVRNDNDFFGAIHLGWDWDFFWGLEFRVGRATPEFNNKTQPTAVRNDSLMITDVSLVYYPSGDTVVRPYCRVGVGWTDFDFPTDSGTRIEASPFTMPFGIGVKWAIRRWMAARLELLDNVTFGDSAVNTHQNFTLVFGLEYRMGAKPKSYWPWNPTRLLQ